MPLLELNHKWLYPVSFSPEGGTVATFHVNLNNQDIRNSLYKCIHILVDLFHNQNKLYGGWIT